MIFATRRNHSRDGELLIVHRNRKEAISAQTIAPNLQAALDNWKEVEPELQALSQRLNANDCLNCFDLDTATLLAPLPRTYAWLDASAFLNHVELARKARGVALPSDLLTVPLMYRGGGERFLGPTHPIDSINEDFGIDFEAEVAVIVGEVPIGVSAKDATESIRLLTLCNDISLRHLIPDELARGFGFVDSKFHPSFAPLAVTPDELSTAWRDGRVHLPLHTWLNGELFGCPNAGPEMHFSFPELIRHAAKTRGLPSGAIIGSGTVSNRDPERGYSCIVEKRMREALAHQTALTPYLKAGDHIRMAMIQDGSLPFGEINQKVARLT